MASYMNNEIPFENCFMRNDAMSYDPNARPYGFRESDTPDLTGLGAILPKLPFGMSYTTAIKYGLIASVGLWVYFRFGKHLLKKSK